jgi:hypothetical protein
VRCSILLAGLLTACAEPSPVGDACNVGSDCESGACRAGVCVDPTASATTATGGGGGGTAESGGGGGAGPGAGGGAACAPDHDGIITRPEVPLEPGLSAKFRAATDVTVPTAPTMVDGVPTWDLSAALPGDHTSLLETLPLSGQWFAAEFTGASYAARLSETEDVLGVFEITGSDLLIRGVVSPEAGVTQTLLTYADPPAALAFPLEVGKVWASQSMLSGLTNGIASTYLEEHETTVDARGDVVTPFATFDALRVRVELTRWVGAIPTTQRTYLFVTECFGTIASVASQPNETVVEFDDAAEVRRLSP